MARDIRFELELRVVDAVVLRNAAEERAVKEGWKLVDWRKQRDSATDDVLMLLDPAVLPGCSIYGSSAEEL